MFNTKFFLWVIRAQLNDQINETNDFPSIATPQINIKDRYRRMRIFHPLVLFSCVNHYDERHFLFFNFLCKRLQAMRVFFSWMCIKLIDALKQCLEYFLLLGDIFLENAAAISKQTKKCHYRQNFSTITERFMQIVNIDFDISEIFL